MKEKNHLLRVLIIFIVTYSFLTSCRKEPDPFAGSLWLTSSEKVISRSAQSVYDLLSGTALIYPELAQLMEFVVDGVDVYRITYNTEFMGRKISASGLVCLPKAAGEYPVMSFQNGTNSLHANAPSVNPDHALYRLLESIAAMGYVIAIPDYIGFGTSSDIFHPYMHRESTGRSLVDMLYALREFEEDVATGTRFLNEYYLMGYSQGGWASLVLLDALENGYQQDFNVAACAGGGGPYSLLDFNHYVLELEEYPSPGFLAYVSKSYIDHGLITKNLSDLFYPPYSTNIDQLFNGLYTIDEINTQLTTSITSLFTPGYLEGFSDGPGFADVRNALQSNSIQAWASQVPMLLVHGDEDSYVPPFLTDKLYDDMIMAGTSPSGCSKLILPGKDHGEGIVPFSVNALLFFKELSR